MQKSALFAACLTRPETASLGRLKADHTGRTLTAHLISQGPSAQRVPPRPEPSSRPHTIYLPDKYTCHRGQGRGTGGVSGVSGVSVGRRAGLASGPPLVTTLAQRGAGSDAADLLGSDIVFP